MNEIAISANDLFEKLLSISTSEPVWLLDSCGTEHHNSHLMIAGIRPVKTIEITSGGAADALKVFNDILSNPDFASIFTLSYELGLALENIKPRPKKYTLPDEPFIFLSQFGCLIIHDYDTGKTRFEGNPSFFEQFEDALRNARRLSHPAVVDESHTISNFSKDEYLTAVESIQEYIREGETYQTNLTQQFQTELPEGLTPQHIFRRLRRAHPAPFAAFIRRPGDFVVSISPERFALIENNRITVSPVKGTRPRGMTPDEDRMLTGDLLTSPKDRAENTMIVDLLRNDIGRVCEYGSVVVEKLCELSEHPTLFHLVSTINGTLRKDATFTEVIRAIYPSGSITGCPKIRTMEIIDRLENAQRGLSMGAIGYRGFDNRFDLNVAIRTMVVRGTKAVFNVGGGIVIDSDPLSEYNESLTKARAILKVLNAKDWF